MISGLLSGGVVSIGPCACCGVTSVSGCYCEVPQSLTLTNIYGPSSFFPYPGTYTTPLTYGYPPMSAPGVSGLTCWYPNTSGFLGWYGIQQIYISGSASSGGQNLFNTYYWLMYCTNNGTTSCSVWDLDLSCGAADFFCNLTASGLSSGTLATLTSGCPYSPAGSEGVAPCCGTCSPFFLPFIVSGGVVVNARTVAP